MLDAPVLDLLGDPPPRTRAKPTLAASAALREVLVALRAHPRVVRRQRLNSGAALFGTRYVKFGLPGCPDILGQLRDVARELGPLEGGEPACSRRAGTGTPASRMSLIEQVDTGAAK